MIAVVTSESAANSEAIKRAPSTGNTRRIKDPRRLFLFSSFGAFSLAGDFGLLPMRIEINPETPPIETRRRGDESKAIGPKITITLTTNQPIVTIISHAPERAHHSRSSSSMLRLLLVTPMKSVAPIKNTNINNGTAAQAHNSVVHVDHVHSAPVDQNVHGNAETVFL